MVGIIGSWVQTPTWVTGMNAHMTPVLVEANINKFKLIQWSLVQSSGEALLIHDFILDIESNGHLSLTADSKIMWN